MRARTGLKINSGLVLGVLLLFFVACFAVRSGRLQVHHSRLLDHSYAVLRAIESLHLRLLEAESGSRGFALSGNDVNLAHFESAIETVQVNLEELLALTMDNPGQHGILREIQPVVDEKIEFMNGIVEARRVRGLNDAVAMAMEGRGRELMERITDAIGRFENEERRLLAVRNQEAIDGGQMTLRVALFGCALAVVLAAWGGYSVHRDLFARKQAEDALLNAKDELEVRVAERTQDLAQTLEKLKESEARFSGIIGSAMDGIVAIDEDQRIILFNSAAEAMFGYRVQEILGQPLERLIPERMRSAHREHIKRFGNTQITNRRMGALGNVWGLRADGAEFPLEASISQIVSKGQRYFTVILRDITERAVLEREATRRSKQQAALLQLGQRALEADRVNPLLDEAVSLMSETLEVEMASVAEVRPDGESMRIVAGVGLGEGVVGSLTIGVGSDTLSGYTLQRNETVAVEDFRTDSRFGEMPLPRAAHVVSALCAPLRGHQRPFGVLGVYTRSQRTFSKDDVHCFHAVANILSAAIQRLAKEEEVRCLNIDLEQRVAARTADLERSNKQLESFSYSVSHDLRVPLRAVDGFTRILEEDYASNLDSEGRRILQVIRQGTRNMSALIDDLLAFSRVNRQPLRFADVDMNDLARSTVTELTGDKPARRDQFLLGPLPSVRGDAALLKQVFINLVSNALKFSEHVERPQIEISGERNCDRVVYHVRDNGAGFDMEYAGKLFQVFQRLHSKDEFEGTGVGLALAKSIVTRHGGDIWAEGRVGEGAVFHVSLPCTESKDDR